MNPPGLDQVEKAQGLIERGPAAFAAAVFALAFVWMLFVYMRAKDRHLANVASLDKEHRLELAEAQKAHALALADLNKERLQQAIQIETTLAKFLQYIDKVSRRRPAPKEEGNGGAPGP